MRELESSLQQFGEFLLKAQLVRETVAPHVVRRVRRFLSRPRWMSPWRTRCGASARRWSGTAETRTGKSARQNKRSASTSSTSSSERTGIGGRLVRWWMSKGGRVRWRRWSNCVRA